jgi:hypothetical protein
MQKGQLMILLSGDTESKDPTSMSMDEIIIRLTQIYNRPMSREHDGGSNYKRHNNSSVRRRDNLNRYLDN